IGPRGQWVNGVRLHWYQWSLTPLRHEIRIQHGGRPYRVLYAFDPRRMAILLIGGNKTGNDRWYETSVPLADRLYDEHPTQLYRSDGRRAGDHGQVPRRRGAYRSVVRSANRRDRDEGAGAHSHVARYASWRRHRRRMNTS